MEFFGRMRLEPAIAWRLSAIGAVFTLIAALLAACGTSGGGGAPSANLTTGSTGNAGAVKVAFLLPITGSGNTPAVATALRQAGELALFEFNNPNVTLIPKDTRGTPAGARAAAESAVAEGVELILGPVFAQEVSAAAPVARRAGIPIIAFSSDEKVAGNGVYLLSFVAGREVPRVVSFATGRGKRNFAALIPQSSYGRLVEASFARAVTQSGGQLIMRAQYPPNDAAGMHIPVRQIADAVKAGRVDTIMLPASQEELASLAPLLAQNEIDSRRAQLIGTGVWDFDGIGRSNALVGGWYAGPDLRGWYGFTKRYSDTYGGTPPRLASLAYDAVSLAVSLSNNQPGQRYSMMQLTRSSGFAGIDGLFRLRSDGTAERGLAILEVTPSGPRVIESAPAAFAGAQY
jgi:branched-chain amino acid transport system substrate-binding protein